MLSVLIKGGRMINTTLCARITEQVETPSKQQEKNVNATLENMQACYRFYFRQFGHDISYIAFIRKLGPETIWGQWKDFIAIFTKHSFVK